MDEKVMYVFINKGLGMSNGKACAQASHAAVKAYLLTSKEVREKWDSGSYTKIILGAKNSNELEEIAKEIYGNNLNVWLVRDEGRTELEPGSLTALAVEIVDKGIYKKLFSKFDLLR